MSRRPATRRRPAGWTGVGARPSEDVGCRCAGRCGCQGDEGKDAGGGGRIGKAPGCSRSVADGTGYVYQLQGMQGAQSYVEDKAWPAYTGRGRAEAGLSRALGKEEESGGQLACWLGPSQASGAGPDTTRDSNIAIWGTQVCPPSCSCAFLSFENTHS